MLAAINKKALQGWESCVKGINYQCMAWLKWWDQSNTQYQSVDRINDMQSIPSATQQH